MPEPDIDAIVRELERAQANYEAGRISNFDLMCIRSAHMPVILDALEESRCPITDTYACQKCGRKDGMDTSLHHDDWAKVEAHTGCGILCMWCINAACEDLGIRVIAKGVYFSGEKVVPPNEGGGIGLLSCAHDSGTPSRFGRCREMGGGVLLVFDWHSSPEEAKARIPADSPVNQFVIARYAAYERAAKPADPDPLASEVQRREGK